MAVNDEVSPSTRMLSALLDGAHLAAPDELDATVAAAAAVVGWSADLFYVNYEQTALVNALDTSSDQDVESTLAGRAFRDVQAIGEEVVDRRRVLWVPLVDSVERLGVIRIVMPDTTPMDSEETIDRLRWFAHLTGHLVAGKAPYGDNLHRRRLTRVRSVASELIWSLLPPLTMATHGLVISGLLEPAYDVAGDAFDYAVDDGVASFGIIDATGHDLRSGTIGAVALSAYRSGRRQQLRLDALTSLIDDSLSSLEVDTFATGAFCQLDLSSGVLTYVNAGHPQPMILRDGRIVRHLAGGHRPLLGLKPRSIEIGTEALEPGDWIILYTDGVTEARDAERTFYGLPRFIDTIERGAAAGKSAPETLRRIVRSILEHQHGVLQDDATILVVQWATSREWDLQAVGGGAVLAVGAG